MKLAAGLIVTRLISGVQWQRHVYLNEMEMRIWLCKECLWGDLEILLEKDRSID